MSKFLDDLKVFLETQPFKIIRASEIIGTNSPETIEQTEANPCQDSYSVAKTFTMTAIGILYDRKMLNLSDKVCDILKDELPEERMDSRWYDATVEMALTHSLGLPEGCLDIDAQKATGFGRNYLHYLFRCPLEYNPGEGSKYSDGAFYLLSVIVEKISGKPLDDFLWSELLYDLEYLEFAFSRCPMGHAMGGTGLYARSEDIVKLGALYLNKGIYKGKRLLSEEWTKLAVEKDYAFGWDEERMIYSKGGICGQKLMVIPSQNRALFIHAYGADTGIITDFVKNYS